MRQRLLATMITTTTYGTWPPGDLRGYVEKGIVLPGDPRRLRQATDRMTGEPVLLSAMEQNIAYDALLAAAAEFAYRLFALLLEAWHLHLLLDHQYDDVAKAVGRIKTRMRQAVNRGRIWTAGYDKQFCFDEAAVERRMNYINRHVGARPVH